MNGDSPATGKEATAFHTERIGKEQWRLTSEGIVARTDLENGDSAAVFDFVLLRGFFDGRPKLMPDGRAARPAERRPGRLPSAFDPCYLTPMSNRWQA